MYPYKNIFISILFSFVIFLVSCSDALFQKLNVSDVIYDDAKITITFTTDVDEDSVQKSITLLEDSATVIGYFQCLDSQIVFFPSNGIQKNYDYDLIISTACEDRNGNSLMQDYHFSFSTRDEHERPHVISIVPTNQQYIDTELNYIDITFSEPILQESFINALDISPSIEFFLEFNDNNSQVKIIPQKPLTLNTDYVITINTELSDLARNTMLEEKKYMFFYNRKDILPDYKVSIYDTDDLLITELNPNANEHNIPANCSIRIDFEHKMDLSAVSAYFYFTPIVDYKILKDEINGKYVIFNITNAQWNAKYDLTFLNGMPDIYGQRYQYVQVYTFTTDNELNMPPKFLEGIIQTSDWKNSTLYETIDYAYLSEEKNYSNISFSNDYTVGNARKSEAYLLFYTSNQSNGIDVYSLRDGLSVSTTNNCCQIVIKTIEKMDTLPSNVINLFNVDFSGTAGKVDIFYVVFEVTNSSNSGLVHFILETEIQDTLKNQLDRKYDFILNK
ncbi:Ig-like domain-containing protein [Treponema sp. Marseille-Q3903]|uniref:Ig-like domain-containing protein n=1 Tax=Treponema sp. Marseille-Q3903 TaxID=2766703 RepID=UPI001651DB90|nr:Ig-like domain-containing protein [Treponema sp. Marseille-Q3903]MBC6714049.1 Ig-like domain-containing protein [Treponema sp. Marseille-Q3903]